MYDDEILKQQTKESDFEIKKSSASFKIKHVENILFGSISSRFWMLRKHINSLSNKDFYLERIPFYSWECITIVIAGREIDLVIKNEACMTMFLKYLVYKMKTVDGS